MKRQPLIYLSAGLFAGTLALALYSHGTGVVRDDLERNISIPDQLTMPLELKVAYNDRDIFFRYRWPAERPHIVMDVLRYTNGQWVRHGSSVAGPRPDHMYEDRVTMLVDDGSVPEFQRYGGYITVGDGMRFFTGEARGEQVAAHPALGRFGDGEIRKYLPQTRSDVNDWRSVVDERALAAQRQAGYFLDLWHWRAHRSSPIGWSDDQHIAEYRISDSGRGPYFTNWDGDVGQPRLMFDPDQVGFHALQWDELLNGAAAFDSIYYLSEAFAVPFDPDRQWQEGDTIPRRVLRVPEGARGQIAVHGDARWVDGYWDVTLRRAKDTGFPEEDKIFRDSGVYDVAVAVHRNATGSRWHYVSLPLKLGLGRSADVEALSFAGPEPDWDQTAWREVTLFYPGQVNWPHLVSSAHAGSEAIRTGVPVKYRHSEAQLAQYGVEAEFREEIRRQWWLSLLAGILLIVSFLVALNLLLGRKEA